MSPLSCKQKQSGRNGLAVCSLQAMPPRFIFYGCALLYSCSVLSIVLSSIKFERKEGRKECSPVSHSVQSNQTGKLLLVRVKHSQLCYNLGPNEMALHVPHPHNSSQRQIIDVGLCLNTQKAQKS